MKIVEIFLFMTKFFLFGIFKYKEIIDFLFVFVVTKIQSIGVQII